MDSGLSDTGLMDVGAQAERTALAWQRTGIAAMAVGALLVRWHTYQHLLPPWPGPLLAAAGGLTALVLVPRRYHRVLRTVRAGHTPRSRAMIPAAALLLLVVTLGIGAEIGAELLH